MSGSLLLKFRKLLRGVNHDIHGYGNITINEGTGPPVKGFMRIVNYDDNISVETPRVVPVNKGSMEENRENRMLLTHALAIGP